MNVKMRRATELKLELADLDTCMISECRNCAIDSIKYRNSEEPSKIIHAIESTKRFWNDHCRFCGFEISENERRLARPYPWKMDRNGNMYRNIDAKKRYREDVQNEVK